MNDWDHPDWDTPARPGGFAEWEKSLHTPLDPNERAVAARAWDAAWIAHARWSAPVRLDAEP